MKERSDEGTGGSSRPRDRGTAVTVAVALAANLVIAVAKAAGGVFSGSPALLSEAAHSVADSLNEVFLFASLRRSKRAPDSLHPFGYGKERYFWSLLAAVGIFITGGCFSFYQGVQAWRHGGEESHSGYLVGLAVLGVALAADGGSLARAVFQARVEQRGRGGPAWVRRAAGDPALRTVMAEDSAAVLGVLLAIAGMVLHLATGDRRWEAGASLLIGLMLVLVAYQLGREAQRELIGQAVDPALQSELRAFLDAESEVDTVTDLLTMRLGPDSMLVAARLDLRGGMDSEDVEQVCMRIRRAMQDRWPGLEQIFLDITDAAAHRRHSAGPPLDEEQAPRGAGGLRER